MNIASAPARHPLRQAVAHGRIERAHARDRDDVRLFMLSFAAFFTCFYAFIF